MGGATGAGACARVRAGGGQARVRDLAQRPTEQQLFLRHAWTNAAGQESTVEYRERNRGIRAHPLVYEGALMIEGEAHVVELAGCGAEPELILHH